MINRRKKKRAPIHVADTQYSSSYSRDNVYGEEVDSEDTVDSGFNPRNLQGALKPIVDAQLDQLELEDQERADARESNLDILDRGSRYKRKSEKLKKFKV